MTNEEYRNHLEALRVSSLQSYDKSLAFLASGALGISLAFANSLFNLTRANHKCLIVAAWVFWVLSLTGALFSHLTSAVALSKTIEEHDCSDENDKVQLERSANIVNKATGFLNWVGGLFFVAGVVFFLAFAFLNFGGKP